MSAIIHVDNQYGLIFHDGERASHAYLPDISAAKANSIMSKLTSITVIIDCGTVGNGGSRPKSDSQF